jgi:hypothetical protein
VTILGEIEILRYVLGNHAAGRTHEAAILRTIERRSGRAAALAFEAGDLVKTRELLAAVPLHRRSWKLLLKGLVAHAPGRAATMLLSLCSRKPSPAP